LLGKKTQCFGGSFGALKETLLFQNCEKYFTESPEFLRFVANLPGAP